jgi:hypothetical protein
MGLPGTKHKHPAGLPANEDTTTWYCIRYIPRTAVTAQAYIFEFLRETEISRKPSIVIRFVAYCTTHSDYSRLTSPSRTVLYVQ